MKNAADITSTGLSRLGWPGIALLAGPVTYATLSLLIYFGVLDFTIIAGYFLWMTFDQLFTSASRQSWRWFYNLKYWTNHAGYFPITLVKTSDLSPDKNYLISIHPHGIFTLGGMTALSTNALNVEKVFPGVRMVICTLKVVFWLPVIREFAYGLGFRSVSEQSLNELLSSQKGVAACIVTGGAAEALLSVPNEYRIILNTRKGFCRVAYKNGCDLVPVYAFGESDTYYQYKPRKDTLLHIFQECFKKITTVAPPFFYGEAPLRLFPRKVPITVVVGRPIPVRKIESPTAEDIRILHERYKKELIDLFNRHKREYLANGNAELIVH